eukprot:174231_1
MATLTTDALISLPIRWKTDIQPMLDMGLFDEVDLYFQSHIERNPHESISLCLYGYFLHFQREFDKSEKIFKKCLSIDPINVICLNYYTDLLSAQKRWDDAYLVAQKAYQLDNQRAWTIGSYCNVLRHLKKSIKVQELCKYALSLSNLNDADTWMTLADCCWDLKLHSLAVEIFEVALQRNPSDFELRDAFSELCIEIKELNKAAVQLKLLSEANPSNYTVHTDYGYVLREIGKIKEARHHYECALSINNEYPGAHNNLGFLLLHDVGDIEKAHHHLLMALKYDASFPNPYRHLADLYRIQNKFDASKMFYVKSLELRTNYKEALYGLQVIELLERNKIRTQMERKNINQLDINVSKIDPYQSYLKGLDLVKAASLIEMDTNVKDNDVQSSSL